MAASDDGWRFLCGQLTPLDGILQQHIGGIVGAVDQIHSQSPHGMKQAINQSMGMVVT